MTITDIIILFFLAISTTCGFFSGIFQVLIGPTSLILSTIACYFIYLFTQNMVVSIIACIPVQFIISWLLKLTVKNFIPPMEDNLLSIISRLGGGIVSLAWSGLIAGIIVALLGVLPLERFELNNLSKDVRQSTTFSLLRPLLVKRGFIAEPVVKPSDCLGGLCKMTDQTVEDLAEDPEVKEIMNDPRMQKLSNDPKAMEAVEKRDIQALLSNPVVAELTADPSFLVKAMKVYGKLQRLSSTSAAESKTSK